MSSNVSETKQGILAMIAIVLAAGLIWAFILGMIYGGYGANQMSAMNMSDEGVEARIRPVVTLADIRGDGQPTEPKKEEVVTAAKSPADLYNGACAACHAAGIAGAPKLGDKAAWEPRYANGLDMLVSSVISGKGAMPPKGGSSYSDAEIQQVVEYMLAEAGLMEKKN